MKYLKDYFLESYLLNIMKYELIYKYNYNLKMIYLGSSKLIYMNNNKYNLVILSRIYKIIRETYNVLNIKIIKKTKIYLKGRKRLDKIQLNTILISLDFFLTFNYLLYNIYRILIKYNGLCLISIGEKKNYINFFWNDFLTRLIQLNESLQKETNKFFKIDLYKLTLNLFLKIKFNFKGDKMEFLMVFLSFFGFLILKQRLKKYQYFIRII